MVSQPKKALEIIMELIVPFKKVNRFSWLDSFRTAAISCCQSLHLRQGGKQSKHWKMQILVQGSLIE